MLKKKYRLRKATAFSATFRLKNCKSNDYFVMYCGSPKKDNDYPTKAGFVVSKKIHKRAVKRNKIKRRLREIYYDLMKNNEIPSNIQNALSFIVIAKSKTLDTDFSELKISFDDLIQKF